MKLRTIFILAVLVAVGLTSAYAGSDRKIGTAGAQELVIPVGSRGTSMGGAVIANSYGLDAIYWNPAGLATMEGTEAMFSHLPYIADIDVNYGAIGTYVDGFGSLAASVKVVSIGDIEETTEAEPEGTGAIYSPTLSVVGISYARDLTAAVQFGVTTNIISERVFDVSANGLSFDFGVTYSPNWHGVTLGIAIKNYGPNMQFKGIGFDRSFEDAGRRRVSLKTAPFELPTSINMGVAYNFMNDGLSSATFSGNFRSNNHANDIYQGGVEYAYNDRWFLRAGYNYADQEEYLYGISLGGGLAYTFGDTKVTLEYSWTDTEIFQDNQFFTVKLGF